MMEWLDIEQRIATIVRQELEGLDGCEDTLRYVNQIKRADDTLKNLHRGANASYDVPRMGTAYLLRYHLSRADNIAALMRELNKLKRRSIMPANLKRFTAAATCLEIQGAAKRPFRVLDIGSGTGATASGILYSLQRNRAKVEPLPQVDITGVEPSDQMDAAAQIIIDDLSTEIQGRAKTAGGTSLTYRRNESNNLNSFTQQFREEPYDWIMFCYTFSVMSEGEERQTLQDVLRLIDVALSPGGIAMFLTAKVKAKQDFQQKVNLSLSQAGLLHFRPGLYGYSSNTSFAPARNPVPILEVRSDINELCFCCERSAIYGDNPEGDYPYYGMFADCDIFVEARQWQSPISERHS